MKWLHINALVVSDYIYISKYLNILLMIKNEYCESDYNGNSHNLRGKLVTCYTS